MTNETTAIEKAKVIEQDVIAFVKTGEQITIETQEDISTATEFLGNLKARFKRIEEIRVGFVKPLNDTVKNLNKVFKAQQAPLTALERTIKGKMGAWQLEQEKIARLAQKKAEEEAKKNSTPEAPVVAPIIKTPAKSTSTSSGTSSMKKVWKFKIIDAEKVPVKYQKPDEVFIRKMVQLGERNIPGVKIYEDIQVSIR